MAFPDAISLICSIFPIYFSDDFKTHLIAFCKIYFIELHSHAASKFIFDVGVTTTKLTGGDEAPAESPSSAAPRYIAFSCYYSSMFTGSAYRSSDFQSLTGFLIIFIFGFAVPAFATIKILYISPFWELYNSFAQLHCVPDT